ncbi:hypothetical protein [Novosphingobium sp.]|uniref:hypothetical protein n=1 Tax=Novosphingobium sp. TaxID=1874826 RepID=UPI003BA98981
MAKDNTNAETLAVYPVIANELEALTAQAAECGDLLLAARIQAAHDLVIERIATQKIMSPLD